MSEKKKMNLPNRLTIARIILTPLCMVVIMLKKYEYTALIGAFLFLIISLTDMLDGKIARKRNLITDFGKFLDPLADKFLVVGTMLALIYRSVPTQLDTYTEMSANRVTEEYPEYIFLLLIIMTIVTVFREFAVSSVRLVASKANVVVPANMLGKIKTVSQMIFVMAFLVEPFILAFDFVPDVLAKYPPITLASAFTCTLFTILSGGVYLKSYLPYISSDI